MTALTERVLERIPAVAPESRGPDGWTSATGLIHLDTTMRLFRNLITVRCVV
ncbi:hypothetical protein OG230_35490 [Streptomyces sp. NBC_00234]|uniref:hypothetical protein n=1 Tax=Streptomyces sp. NBC_00234 TaxID=2903638 RepID=UPI002E2D8859|nr:hypothetical protein [Streptomyces sp. NBC_00234]